MIMKAHLAIYRDHPYTAVSVQHLLSVVTYHATRSGYRAVMWRSR